MSQLIEPDPNQKRTANVIALNASFATLAGFQTGHLLAFAVQLLNLPSEVTRLLCVLRSDFSLLVSDNEVRAVGRHRNPETLHLVVFRKAFDFQPFA